MQDSLANLTWALAISRIWKGKKFIFFLGSIFMESDIGILFLLWRQLLYLGGSPGARKREESDWWEVALKSPLELLMMIPTYTYKWLTYNLAFYFLLCFTSRENKESIGGVCTETEQMCPIFFQSVNEVDTHPFLHTVTKLNFAIKYFSPQKLSILIIVKRWFWRFFNSFFLSAGKKFVKLCREYFSFWRFLIIHFSYFIFQLQQKKKNSNRIKKNVKLRRSMSFPKI